jgi:diacylglycerol kinase family enzyme
MAFKRALIFFNPTSTHAAAGKLRIEELGRILGKENVETIETSPDGRQANADLVAKAAHMLDRSTILGIVAGDGTANQIIEALLTHPDIPDKARRAVILPLWGGNANDLAHMLNGPAYKAKLRDILQKGQVIHIYPLQCDLTQKKGTTTYLAACYASLGITGFVARRLVEPRYRKSKLHRIPGGTAVADILTVISALMEAPSFGIKEHGNRTDIRSVYELSFYNGSRMAKIERLPARLTDELFYLNTFENKKILSILPRFFNFARKRVSQKLLRSYASFTTQEESWAQFDGEPVKVPAHTNVQIQLYPRPFYALSTALKPPERSSEQDHSTDRNKKA